jgi:hypothetical protein
MNNSESPLIRDVEHSYGSVAPTSAICKHDVAMANDSNRPSDPGFIARNAGILLIISAQFFFACMSISVKMLNRLDPPVHALEVGRFPTFDPSTNLSMTGYRSEDGMIQNCELGSSRILIIMISPRESRS